MQSHLSENQAEMAWVRQLHPDCRQYWETYKKYGLWNDRTVMAHCVWSDERERAAMKDAGVTVVHCADSNQNLCSGVAPVRGMLDEGVKVALGSDIAGGDHLDLFDVTASVRASKARRMMDDWSTPFLTVAEGWYLATSAGAEFFGEQPGFAAGNSLHAIVLADDTLPQPRTLTPAGGWNGRCTAVRRGRTGSLVCRKKNLCEAVRKLSARVWNIKNAAVFDNLPKTAALFLHFIAVAAYSIGSVGITAR